MRARVYVKEKDGAQEGLCIRGDVVREKDMQLYNH